MFPPRTIVATFECIQVSPYPAWALLTGILGGFLQLGQYSLKIAERKPWQKRAQRRRRPENEHRKWTMELKRKAQENKTSKRKI